MNLNDDDKRIRDCLDDLDGIARGVDHYEYGLPLMDDVAYDRMTAVVRRALESALAAERAKTSALIAAWPTSCPERGVILYGPGGDNWWLEDMEGARFLGCSDGPYPTREAAVLAMIASKSQETPT